MPIENLISISFTDAELATIDNALTALETAFAGRLVQLTKKESQQYGKLGNETENWTNMVHDDVAGAPAAMVPAFVDKAEWDKDEKVRDQLSARVTRMENIAQQLTDTNRLVGYDIYQTCRTVYNNVKYMTTQSVPGAKVLYDKWSVQFPAKRKKNTAPTS